MASFSVFLFLLSSVASLQTVEGTQWYPHRVPDIIGLLSITPRPEPVEEKIAGRSDLERDSQTDANTSTPNLLDKRPETTGAVTYFSVARDKYIENDVTRSDLSNNSTAARDTSSQDKLESTFEYENNVRLPDTIRPLHYTLRLQPFVNGNLSIHGFMEVEIEVLEITSEITLHIDGIQSVYKTAKLKSLDDESAFPKNITHFTVDLERHFLTAHLETPLLENEKYSYSLTYITKLNHEPQGFFSFQYSTYDGEDRRFAATAFQPIYARRAFPCFDEPALKATFDISLAREVNMTSISNMPLLETVPLNDANGWVWDVFETTPPMSTYLVAFVISELEYVNATLDDDTVVRIWTRKEDLHKAQFALDLTSAAYNFFVEYFNISYPLPKLDAVVLPSTFSMAFEGWGVIFDYSGSSFLYSPNSSLPASKYQVGTLLAHEVAHQWFGNLVTPIWWTDIWLNEGFASYLENVALAKVKPEWGVEEHQVMKDIHSVLRKDSLLSSHPISIPVYHPEEVSKIFDSITYEKGSSIIRMMNHFLTEDTFKRGLTNFLNRHKFSGANQDNLWEVLTEAGHKDETLPNHLTVKEIMDTWTLQMGYPVINVARGLDGTYAIIDQDRFLVLRNISDAPDLKWWVPLTFTTQESPNFDTTHPLLWLKNSSVHTIITNLPSREHWVLFNIQQTGYYRVNYDDNNWNLLIKQLKENHEVLHVINRAQIVDDALNLALAGRLSYDKALSVTKYLKNEKQLSVWDAAFGNIEHMNSMLANTAAYGGFQDYILSLLLPLYEQMGFDNNPAELLLSQRMKPEVIKWACELGHQHCVRKARDLYRQWMDDPEQTDIVPDNLRHVYCTAIAHGGLEEWEFAWQQYQQTDVDDLKNELIKALTCSKEPWIISRYLEMAFTPGTALRNHDPYRIYDGIASKEYDRNTAWDFLRGDFDIVPMIYGRNTEVVQSFLKAATKNFNTRSELKELEIFLKDHEQDELAKDPVLEAIERTNQNIAWMDVNYDVIRQWLEKHGYATKLKF